MTGTTAAHGADLVERPKASGDTIEKQEVKMEPVAKDNVNFCAKVDLLRENLKAQCLLEPNLTNSLECCPNPEHPEDRLNLIEKTLEHISGSRMEILYDTMLAEYDRAKAADDESSPSEQERAGEFLLDGKYSRHDIDTAWKEYQAICSKLDADFKGLVRILKPSYDASSSISVAP